MRNVTESSDPKQSLINETPRAKFGQRSKLFGDLAERIDRLELEVILAELEPKIKDCFVVHASAVQLVDKESFGDIDIIAQSHTRFWDREFFERIFDSDLVDYHRNGGIYSLLLKMRIGKQVQVDFIHADSAEDFERKRIYYSKGHISSVIGMLGKKLGFKYGTEGVFKRYRDSKGQWRDIPVTGSLFEGMEILGLRPEDWEAISKVDDIPNFLASSRLFSSSFFEPDALVRRDREALSRNVTQTYIVEQIRNLRKDAEIDDPDIIFRTQFTDAYKKYEEMVQKIEAGIQGARVVDGNMIMSTLNIGPGPDVGVALAYLREHYPDIAALTPVIRAEIAEMLKNRS